jgi:hypothetical protein
MSRIEGVLVFNRLRSEPGLGFEDECLEGQLELILMVIVMMTRQ